MMKFLKFSFANGWKKWICDFLITCPQELVFAICLLVLITFSLIDLPIHLFLGVGGDKYFCQIPNSPLTNANIREKKTHIICLELGTLKGVSLILRSLIQTMVTVSGHSCAFKNVNLNRSIRWCLTIGVYSFNIKHHLWKNIELRPLILK